MRAIWIDAGNDPDYGKLPTYGIDSVYFDVRDPRVTATYLADVKRRGYAVGVYAADSWPEMKVLPWNAAGWLSNKIRSLANGPDFPRVCLDIETHDIAGYLIPFLQAWRNVRQLRRTDLTIEGFQGGLFSPQEVAQVVAHVIGTGLPGFVVPQNYTGNMSPLAADRVALDLVEHGFTPTILRGFYDAAHLPERWDGFAFTQGRLP